MKKITCLDIDGNKVECNASDLTLRPSVYGILFKENQVLLVPQWEGFDLPGGGVDLGENIEEALVREFFEETGLTVKPLGVIDTVDNFFIRPINHNPVHSICVYHLVEYVEGELTDEHLTIHEKKWGGMPKWHDLDTIDDVVRKHSIDWKPIVKKAAGLK